MTQFWWDARTVFNRLRLTAVRNRGLLAIREKLSHPDFHTQLLRTLEFSSRLDTPEEALAKVEGWLFRQGDTTQPTHGMRQCWRELKAILEEFIQRTEAKASINSSSDVTQGPLRIPLQRQQPKEHHPRAQVYQPEEKPPSVAPESPVIKTHAPHPPRPRLSDMVATSNERISSEFDVPLRWKDSKELNLPMEEQATQPPSVRVEESISPAQTLREISRESIDSQAHPLTPDHLSRETIQDIPSPFWWDPATIINSLQLRLETRTNALQLNLLMSNDAFLALLTDILQESAPLPDIIDAQKHVMLKLNQMQQIMRPEEPWLEDLWKEIQPLLTLRYRYNSSHDGLQQPPERELKGLLNNVMGALSHSGKK